MFLDKTIDFEFIESDISDLMNIIISKRNILAFEEKYPVNLFDPTFISEVTKLKGFYDNLLDYISDWTKENNNDLYQKLSEDL